MIIACPAGRTRPGNHFPGLSSKLYMRLSHTYSFPADGPCHGNPLAPVAWPDPPGCSQTICHAGLGNSVARRQGIRPALATLPLPVCSGDPAFGRLCPPSARGPRRPIPRLSRGRSLLGSSHPPPHPLGRLFPRGEAAGGYSVPDSRLSLRAGRHSSPGGLGVNPAYDLTTPAFLRVLLDPAQPGWAGWR